MVWYVNGRQSKLLSLCIRFIYFRFCIVCAKLKLDTLCEKIITVTHFISQEMRKQHPLLVCIHTRSSLQ